MPESGPVLVIANHQSYLDPVLVGLASRRYLAYLARESLFRNRFFKGLIESLDALPIDNKGLGKEGLQGTLSLLNRGKCVLVFPEGERTPDGEVHPFKPGISLLIKKNAAPIVPVGIDGAFAAWSRFKKTPSFSPLFLPPNPATIALSVGEAIDPNHLRNLSREESIAFLQQKVQIEFQKARQLKRK
jgi:1-acyl-sn-glycerol-3-phosphate acyltransferase